MFLFGILFSHTNTYLVRITSRFAPASIGRVHNSQRVMENIWTFFNLDCLAWCAAFMLNKVEWREMYIYVCCFVCFMRDMRDMCQCVHVCVELRNDKYFSGSLNVGNTNGIYSYISRMCLFCKLLLYAINRKKKTKTIFKQT